MKPASDEDIFAPLQSIVSISLPIRQILVYSGALPFYLAAIALSFPSMFSTAIVDPLQFLKVYSAVILGFVSGAQWGFASKHKQTDKMGFLLVTNLITLLAVCLVLLLPDALAISACILLLFLLLIMDSFLVKYHAITKHYFGLRRNITFIVSGALVWALLALFIHN